MELTKLFLMQKALDSHIEKKHGLMEEDLVSRKILALLVELGELANETRCFKFWSVKPSSEQSVILEEFVDGVHFILSLGIECGYDKHSLDLKPQTAGSSLTEQFLAVYNSVLGFQRDTSIEAYQRLFTDYLQLACMLDISNEDLEKAYFQKNEVNYQRQENNY